MLRCIVVDAVDGVDDEAMMDSHRIHLAVAPNRLVRNCVVDMVLVPMRHAQNLDDGAGDAVVDAVDVDDAADADGMWVD